MNSFLNTKKYLLIAALGLVTLSCSDDDDDNSGSDQSIVEVAEANASLSTFVQALELAGLRGAFDGEASYTVFAPTNAAFNEFLTVNGYSSIDAVPVDALKELLFNHTIGGTVPTTEMLTGYRSTLAKGSASSTNFLSLYVDMTSGIKLNGISNVTSADIDADNGKINIVDKVIGLPTVMTHVRANPSLAILEAALTFDASSEFDSTLSGNAGDPFTVFAPENAAFSSFLGELGYSSLEEIPAAYLDNILRYHVVTDMNVLSSTLSNNQVIQSATGESFTVTLTGGGKKLEDVNGRFSTLTTADIQAANGVIHMMDNVMLPTLD